MDVDRAIAVATSIPPKVMRQNAGQPMGAEYQRLCVRSWIDAGFRILSINDREEIAALAPIYPEIDFVCTDRNASAWTGRKNPFIADLLGALTDVSEPVVGIINSDLIFEASTAWKERLPSLVGDAVIAGQRYDATSLLNGTFRRFWPGFDFFFFDKATAKILLETAMPFAMGLPFWDYWLPAAVAAAKRTILVAQRPGAVHLMHEHAYHEDALCDFTRIFARFVIAESDRARPLPECLSAILPVCRRIASEKVSNAEMLHRVSDVMMHFLPRIRERIVDLESEPAAPRQPPDVFHRFDQRLAAGEAFERAKGLEGQGRLTDAEREFQSALQNTPDDFDVLMAFGEFLISHGDRERAFQILNRALAQQPNSPRPHNSLGVAYHTMRKHDSAIQCFQSALRVDPQFKFAYLSLAVVLFEANRRREALDCVNEALAKWPHFTEAAELHANMAKALQTSAQPS